MAAATNDAKQFAAFDRAVLRWRVADADADGKAARDKVGLGLRLTVNANQNPIVIPVAPGLMFCYPLRSSADAILEQRLFTWLNAADVKRVCDGPTLQERFDASDIRVIYAFGPSVNDRLGQSLTTHLQAGRFKPVAVTPLNLPRGADAVESVSAPADPTQALQAWLAGKNALWYKFDEAVARADAQLVQLQAGDVLTIYVEAGFRIPGQATTAWYRVNPGFVLPRLADPGESAANYDQLAEQFQSRGVSNGRQAAYESYPTSAAGGIVAPTEIAPRASLCVVAGGSLQTSVLEPVNVVPAPLFSFITCDEIRLFAPVLNSGADVWGSSDLPVLTRRDLEAIWRARHQPPERFMANAFAEFAATDFADQLVQNQAVVRDQQFHDRVTDIVRYDVLGVGHEAGPIPGATDDRTLVPQASAYTRPDHALWRPQPARRHQLRRLYPLRFTIGLGESPSDPPQFSLTQDTIDCIRQEYVFHMNWNRDGTGLYYFQPDFSANAQMKPAEADTRLDQNGALRTDAAGVIPSIVSTSGRIVIPERSALRELDAYDTETIAVPTFGRIERNLFGPFISVYRPITLLPLEWQTRLEEVRARMLTHVTEMNRVLTGVVTPAASTLNSFLRMVLEAFLGVLTTAAPPLTAADVRVESVLKMLYDPTVGTAPSLLDAKARFIADLASATAVLPADVGGLLVRASSGWRPPEHNETTSSTIASNHQVGLALDLQPTLTSRDRRNPLMILALHDVAQKNFGSTAADPLSEALLEDNDGNFIFGRFDETRSLHQIVEVPAGSGSYRVRRDASDAGTDLPVPGPTDSMSASTHPSALAAQRFKKWIDDFFGVSPTPAWPARPPTYLELYLFALSQASHVHFTFRSGISLRLP